MLVCEFIYIIYHILTSKHCKIKYRLLYKYNYMFFPITNKPSVAGNFVHKHLYLYSSQILYLLKAIFKCKEQHIFNVVSNDLLLDENYG